VSTIITRVVDALRANGNDALADELKQTTKNITDGFKQLEELNKRKDRTVRLLINTIQARCKHFQWYLVHRNIEGDPSTWGPEGTIACYECGHTVCDERAYAFGKRVMQGDYSIYSHANGRRFTLNPTLRKQLGDKLIVKEMKEDADEETLRGNSDGVGESQTARTEPA
jgi:hypothetical protein